MGSESSKTDRFIDDAEDVVNSLRNITNVLSNGNRSSTPSFVKDAEDVVKTMKIVNNFSKLLSRDKRREQQSSQSAQPQGRPSTNRAQYTTQQRSNINPAPPNLERARTPYSYTNTDLDNNIRQANSQRLYPNLATVNNGINGLNARNDGDFVVINQYQHQQRMNPSAPPAADVMELPQTAPASNAPKPPQTRCGPSNPGPSNVLQSVLPNKAPRQRSVSRARVVDPRYNCPTCAKRLGLTIYLCEKGHGTCKDCKEGARLCGSDNGRCGAPITGMRNIALEAFVAENGLNQLSQCENEKCTLRFDVQGMEKHLRECPFGEMDCPVGRIFGKCECSSRCKVEDLASHFDSCHKDKRVAELDKEMFIFNICIDDQKLYLIKNGPYNFLVHIKVSQKDHMIYMAVQLVGTAVSSAKWTYEFHVYNKSQPRRKYQYVANCHSISTPLNEILTVTKCAALPTSFAMSFVNESALNYKFFIMKTGESRRRRRCQEWKRQNLDN